MKSIFHNFVKLHKHHIHPTKTITVTGGTGNIAYSLLFRIASGEILGKHTPVILKIYDVEDKIQKLRGLQMELHDSYFPLLEGTIVTTSLSEAFAESDYAILLGARPRSPGMVIRDLLQENAKIFIDYGKAINDNAQRNLKTIVVGNPANTNCLICGHYAKDIHRDNFTAMTRLDHNRALTQLSYKMDVSMHEIEKLAIWGNHSPTMVPDTRYITAAGKPIHETLGKEWINNEFIPKIQNRGTDILNHRSASSAASAAGAIINHMHDWIKGTNQWVSMGIYTDGMCYGIPKDLIFSMPVVTREGSYCVVPDLHLNDPWVEKRIKATTDELINERDAISHLFK